MGKNKLIKIADIKKAISEEKHVFFKGEVAVYSNGFYARVTVGDEDYILATYLSKPRLFKRADALIKEVAELGISHISFDLTDYMEKQKNNIFD